MDAVSSGSWPRGESPCATPPPVVPEGLQVPGQVSAKSSTGHVQVRCSRATGEAQDRSASRKRGRRRRRGTRRRRRRRRRTRGKRARLGDGQLGPRRKGGQGAVAPVSGPTDVDNSGLSPWFAGSRRAGWTGGRRKAAGERVDPVSGSWPTASAIGYPTDATTLRAYYDSAGPLGRPFLAL